MPEKLYRIGDAAQLLGLKTYVLRYWETEFPQLRPVRTGKGQRRYTEADMAALTRIRYLLYDQRMTIEGARKVLTGASALSFSVEPEVPGLGADTDTKTVSVAHIPAEPEAALEVYSGDESGNESGPQPVADPAPSSPLQPSSPLTGGKEMLVQLTFSDFIVPRRLQPESAQGVTLAEAACELDPPLAPAPDEARLRHVTDELRALQSLLRRS